MITDVNCGLSQQLTGLLVNLSTRKLPLIISDVNCGLSLQLTCQLPIKYYELHKLHELHYNKF